MLIKILKNIKIPKYTFFVIKPTKYNLEGKSSLQYDIMKWVFYYKLCTLTIRITHESNVKIPSILLCKYYNKNPIMYTKNV